MNRQIENQQKNNFAGICVHNISQTEKLSYLLAIAIGFVLPISTFLTNIFFIFTIVLYFSTGNFNNKINFIIYNKIARLFLMFCVLFLVGLLYSSGSFNDGLMIFYKYLDKFFYGALLFPLFRNERLRQYSINSFIVGMLLVLALSYFKHFNLMHYHFTFHVDEVFKSHIETNFLMAFASYLIMQKIANHAYCRFWQLIILLCFIFYIFFIDAGRSGYFVFISLLLLFLWQKFSWKGIISALIVITFLFVSAFLFSDIFQSRLKEIKKDVTTYCPGALTSVGVRMDFARNSLMLIKKHPYFGSGTGSFAYEYEKISPNTKVENPHNEFLYMGVQFGILGVAMLLLIFGTQLYQGKNLPKHLQELSQALVVSFFIGCLANSWFRDTTQGHFYVYLSALIFSALPVPSNKA